MWRADSPVCFSCKTRQLCPSCAGRAMSDGARHLVDRVFPDVNVRQYVLVFPFELWGMLAYQPALVNAAQKRCCDSIQEWHQQRAKEYAFPDGKTGGVAVLRRFGSGLNVMPHVHTARVEAQALPSAVKRWRRPACWRSNPACVRAAMRDLHPVTAARSNTEPGSANASPSPAAATPQQGGPPGPPRCAALQWPSGSPPR